MTKRIVEQDIENAALEILNELGYEVLYGPNIAPDSEAPARARWDDAVLTDRLRAKLESLNKGVAAEAIEEAIKKLTRATNPKTIVNNKKFHEYLVNGLEVEVREAGRIKGLPIKIIDFEQPERNEFLAVNQFTILENGHERRPDIVLFINGLPVGLIELKNPASATATIDSAFRQIETYLHEIPCMFNHNEIIIIADGIGAKAGTISSPW